MPANKMILATADEVDAADEVTVRYNSVATGEVEEVTIDIDSVYSATGGEFAYSIVGEEVDGDRTLRVKTQFRVITTVPGQSQGRILGGLLRVSAM
jgi:hypothetical protein